MALARGSFASVVTAAGGVTGQLGDRHHVQGMVELAVPGAGEPMPYDVTGGDLDRCGAVVAGERGC